MMAVLNALGYYATWMAAVIGAGSGHGWLGPAAAMIFITWHLSVVRQPAADLQLLAIAVVLGGLVDSLWVASGILVFASAGPWPGFAPIWILSIWAAFALTLNHCLRALQRRRLIAAALGFVGAPLAYWGAALGWSAVQLTSPTMALLLIGVAWALITPLLLHLAERLDAGERTA